MVRDAFAVSLFALIFAAAPASGFEVRRVDGRIRLRDSSCATVAEIARTLADWAKSTGSERVCPGEALRPAPGTDGTCDSEVTDCVPDQVAKYEGLLPASAGPNCWNLALVMRGILPALRWSSPKEMSFYMQPPLCHELGADEPKRAGDVGAVRDEGAEVHGFIYVSEKVAYSKDGLGKESAYRLQPLADVLRTYDVVGTRANATNRITYFRCISMKDYRDEVGKPSRRLKKADAHLTDFEHCLEESALTGRPLGENTKQDLLRTEKILEKVLEKESAGKTSEDAKDRFELKSLTLRLRSVAGQLQTDGANPELTTDLRRFIERLEKAQN